METTTAKRPILVTIIIPAYNEEETVDRAYEAVTRVFEGLKPEYQCEIIFTDNHSTDRTFELLRAIAAKDERVRVIRFARNFGYQKSLFIGFLNARGDCAIQIDCDLQDPPELLPEMLQIWRAGNAVVYGVRRTRKEGWFITAIRKVFYRFIDAISEHKLPVDAGDFRLMDRVVLDQLHLVDDQTPYLRGLVSTMGFKQVSFPYDRAARTAGESKFNFGAMVKLALDGVVNHSLIPLRLASLSSLIIGAVTLMTIGVYVIAKFIFGADWPAGFATTTVLLLLSITMNALFLGIIGEYLGRIYLQSKRRPLVIVEAKLNADNVKMGLTGAAGIEYSLGRETETDVVRTR